MAYEDLRSFLNDLEARGWLRRVSAPVDRELEISEITRRVVKARGPALWFERVRGFEVPVVTNLFGTYERMALALGVSSLEEPAERLKQWLRPDRLPQGIWEGIRALPGWAEMAGYLPRRVRRAPCQEVVRKEPTIDFLPVLKCWPEDAGPFITLPLVFTRDHDGRQNVGMYRMQVFDGRTLGLHWQVHKDGAAIWREARRRGDRLEVAVALGGDPVLIYAATAPLPRGIGELLLAGFLRRQAVPLVRCLSVDLEVPAEAEIVLEGYVEPEELRTEGPFGDHTGFYSPAEPYPVMHLTCVTHRRDPVYPATVVGPPPMEDAYLGLATERLFRPLVQTFLPEVVDLHLPAAGAFHNWVIVSIKKEYPGQARKVMHGLWGLGQLALSKFIVVVDAEVDVHDLEQVIWQVGANVDPARDLVLGQGPLDALDHAPNLVGYGGKLGIDATRKGPREGYSREWPKALSMSRAVEDLVERRWKEYGL
ncbi:MAG: menaquinone biosynthesis decarboxylase [Clostridia bacterium]|nr:menaquinone biosynthesis decarboxylase [Clostridia bacterium]MDH7573413.1 menaquinone biosynthesis decarboxylase [Clostridia bacterium]